MWMQTLIIVTVNELVCLSDKQDLGKSDTAVCCCFHFLLAATGRSFYNTALLLKYEHSVVLSFSSMQSAP